MSDQLVQTSEAAALLGLKPCTLRAWRLRGTGPAYVRLGTGPGARVGYSRRALEEWIAARTFRSTSSETVSRGS